MSTRFDLATAADIRFGAGRVDEIPDAVTALGGRRVLVVTGSTPARADAVRAGLRDRGVDSGVVAVTGEPTVDGVRAAVAGARADGADVVLGYGGGSALDVAKAVAVLAASGTDPLDHLEVVGAGRPVPGPGLPCVAVPTTAGTGSEVTRNAVLAAADVKASLRSPHLLPRLAVVDPDLLTGLPVPAVVAGGMDALTQLIEPLLSVRANPITDALAREGIARSARSLRSAGLDGMTDPQVREDLALASLLSGLCLANSGLGAVHALAAAAGARLSAPHGGVCAAALTPTLRVTLRVLRDRAPGHPALDRFAEVARLLTGSSSAIAEAAIAWLDDLARTLSVPGLDHYGLDAVEVADLVTAAQQASSMKGHPVPLTDVEVTEIVMSSR